MSISPTRTGETTPRTLEDAICRAIKIAEHVNHTILQVKVEVLNSLAGNYNELHWNRRTGFLADFERIMAKLDRHEKDHSLVQEATEAWLRTNSVDRLYSVHT